MRRRFQHLPVKRCSPRIAAAERPILRCFGKSRMAKGFSEKPSRATAKRAKADCGLVALRIKGGPIEHSGGIRKGANHVHPNSVRTPFPCSGQPGEPADAFLGSRVGALGDIPDRPSAAGEVDARTTSLNQKMRMRCLHAPERRPEIRIKNMRESFVIEVDEQFPRRRHHSRTSQLSRRART